MQRAGFRDSAELREISTQRDKTSNTSKNFTGGWSFNIWKLCMKGQMGREQISVDGLGSGFRLSRSMSLRQMGGSGLEGQQEAELEGKKLI